MDEVDPERVAERRTFPFLASGKRRPVGLVQWGMEWEIAEPVVVQLEELRVVVDRSCQLVWMRVEMADRNCRVV
jgi:hypothetical protein